MGNQERNKIKETISVQASCVCGVWLLLRQQGRRPAVTTASRKKKKKAHKFNEPCLVYTHIHTIKEVQIYR